MGPSRRSCTIAAMALEAKMGVKLATSPVPRLLAQLKSAVLRLMDRAGVGTVARQMRDFAAHPEQALALVLTGSCSV
jgi:hypothetical protein